MAKITIEIMDRSDGKVAVIATPSFGEMAKRVKATGTLTPAETMATLLLKRIHDEHLLEQRHGKGSGLWLPDANA